MYCKANIKIVTLSNDKTSVDGVEQLRVKYLPKGPSSNCLREGSNPYSNLAQKLIQQPGSYRFDLIWPFHSPQFAKLGNLHLHWNIQQDIWIHNVLNRTTKIECSKHTRHIIKYITICDSLFISLGISVFWSIVQNNIILLKLSFTVTWQYTQQWFHTQQQQHFPENVHSTKYILQHTEKLWWFCVYCLR